MKKPLTDTQREARRRRNQRQQTRIKAELEAARREQAERQTVPNVLVPLVRPARGDEQFQTTDSRGEPITFCGRPIRVLRVGREEA